MYLVYLKYWISFINFKNLNFMPLTVYPKVLLPPNLSIKAVATLWSNGVCHNPGIRVTVLPGHMGDRIRV